jgi:O-antigen ligase
MLSYTIICLISYFISEPELVNSQNPYRWLVTIVNMTLYPFVGYYVSKTIGFSDKAVRAVIHTLLLMSAYLGVTGILEHYKIFSLVWPDYIVNPNIGTQFGRARGPFVESSTMGRVLCFTTLSSIYFYLTNKKKKLSPLILIIILISMAALYFTYTRGAWVAFALGLIAMSLFNKEIRNMSILLCLMIVIIYFSGIAGKFSASGGTLFSKRKQTIEYRYINYDIAFRMIKEKPYFGIGYGKFNSEWFNYIMKTDRSYFEGFDGNHNTFLGIFAELGLIGMVPYMLIIVLLSKKILNSIRSIIDGQTDLIQFCSLVFGMSAGYMAAAQFVDYRFQSLQNSIVFVFVGLLISQINKLEETKPS